MPDGLAKPARWWPGIRDGHPLARGLVGYWPFWEGQGGKAYDVANPFDIANHGTLTNGPTWESGPNGTAIETAVTDYINVPDSPSLQFLDGDFTVAAKILVLLAGTEAQSFVNKRLNGGLAQGLNLWVDRNNNLIKGQIDLGATSTTQVTQAVSNATRYFVVFYRRGTTVGLSIDGGTPDTQTGAGYDADVNSAQPLRFGANRSLGSGNYFEGQYDFVSIWSRAITASQVDELADDPYTLIRQRAKTYIFATGGAPPASIVVLRRRRECA